MESRIVQPQYAHSLSAKILTAWLAAGLLWFSVGIAWVPDAKLYRQGLVVFLWLPALVSVVCHRQVFRHIFSYNKTGVVLLGLFLAWAGLSIAWSPADDPSTNARRILYVSLFLCGIAFLSHVGRTLRPSNIMTAATFGLALAALVSILIYYVAEDRAWAMRLEGIGLIDHPILGGYVIGFTLLWLSANVPQKMVGKLATWAAISALFAFTLLTQSRGLWVALLGTAIGYSILQPGRRQWLITVTLCAIALVGYFLFKSYIIARGVSFRPAILEESLLMIASKPWLGLGLGADYDIKVGEYVFSHSHNLFTHIAIELGLPGLLLWLAIWGYCIAIAWNHRRTTEGAAVIKIFIFCTIALLFDVGSLLKSPRAEWFLSWLPVALAMGLKTCHGANEKGRSPWQ